MPKIIFFLLFFTLSLWAKIDFTLDTINFYNEEFTIWIAIFSLALLTVLALFLSSERVRRLNKKTEDENRIKEGIMLEVFYKETLEDAYSKEKSSRFKLRKGINNILLSIPSDYINNNIRIDLVNKQGAYKIYTFSIYEE